MLNQENNYHNDWTKNISNLEEKLALAKKVASFVKDGDIIGFGSGSTALLAVREIAKKVKNEKLHIQAIPTSSIIKNECEALQIPLTNLSQNKPDWGFDGADEVDGHNWLIKGRGGAMYSEKMVIASSPKTYILVDNSKFVKSLGEKCPLPIEVQQDKCSAVKTALKELGLIDIALRYEKENVPYVTEQGNYILDCKFRNITHTLEKEINSISGVVENGLFIGYNIEILK